MECEFLLAGKNSNLRKEDPIMKVKSNVKAGVTQWGQ